MRGVDGALPCAAQHAFVGHPTAKGSILTALLEFLESDLSAAQRDELFAIVDPGRAMTGRGKVLPTSRIPIGFLNHLMTTAAEVKGEPLPSFARRAGRAAADSTLKGVYRAFARIVAPGVALSRVAALWTSIYDSGRMEATRSGSGATIKVVGMKLERATCERIHGWLERITEMNGRRNLRIDQTHCCSRGEDHCEWQISWT